jgi:hypothetical protein
MFTDVNEKVLIIIADFVLTTKPGRGVIVFPGTSQSDFDKENDAKKRNQQITSDFGADIFRFSLSSLPFRS